MEIVLTMAKLKNFGPHSPQAIRMRLVREKLGQIYGLPNQTAFARYLGLSLNTWNNYERGHPVSRQTENKLREKFKGLDLNWLRDGDERYLSPAMASLLADPPGKGTKRG